ncbi:hypothetical protein A4A49_52171 [Nicotiana attenuata]|uniref:Uncharacterized protein n=1 Tax=Nicotiana attenuata TaxID=49451 RepID=A0A314L7N0_NICAT|nr:hypothetical protein A4A49_52171 [Nicotiana attenuata]
MTRGLKSFAVLILINLLFSSSIFLNSEARPLNVVLAAENPIEKIWEGLYAEAIKTGGPSSRGEGHKYIDASTLGGVKNSGPSPGMNH